MMARKDKYWTGWAEYRHGPKKKVTLAPVMKKEERKRVINGVFDLLQDWRLTPFENEGAVRAGVRSGLCLQGTDWSRADLEAANVITAAFQRMGTPRPSWDQGQPQYTIADENCNWCGVEIPNELRENGRGSRFCSTVCASSALQHREYEGRRKDSAFYRSAISMVRREERPLLQCHYCERSFKPFGNNFANQRYCSKECVNLSFIKIPERECLTCRTTFKPDASDQRFCSRRCHAKRPVDPRNCECCKKVFTPTSYQAFLCSKSCKMRMHRMRKAAQRGMVYNPSGTTFDGTCVHCHEPFLAKVKRAIYCSPKCKSAARYEKNKGSGRIIPFVPVYMLTTQVIDGWFARAA